MKKIITLLKSQLIAVVFSVFFSPIANAQLPYLLKDIYPGSGGSIGFYGHDITYANGMLFFIADNGTNGYELWKSDGTAAGTAMVKDIYPGTTGSTYTNANSKNIISIGGVVFFIANDGTNGYELWKSDGTASGTVMVKDINPGSTQSVLPSDGHFVELNGVLYFNASDGVNGYELWKSDGTTSGTVMVKDIAISSSPRHFINVNGTLYFIAGNDNELWKSDGTAPGTVMVKDINPGSGSSLDNRSYFTNINGTIYFRATDGVNGYELWKSDGTAAGTVMVKDINVGSVGSLQSIYYSLFTNVNGTLFFSANDGFNGEELWKSDGTAAGTVMVKNISPIGSSSIAWLTDVNGTLFFQADDGTNGDALWKSDGTAAGTVMVTAAASGGFFINVNGTLYGCGAELWKSDGTAAGTVSYDINPGTNSSSSTFLTNINGTLYFSATDGTTGTELWALNTTTGIEQWSKSENWNVSIYPNPFTDNTSINYSLEKNSAVNAELYNIIGEKVAVVLNHQNQSSGNHQVNMNSKQFNPNEGIYLVKLSIDGKVITKKVLMVR